MHLRSSLGSAGVLAFTALLTAFYTMRQITLTFLGKPRTGAAGHAHESKWTMTLPLLILAVFAVAAGWFGIHEGFPLIGRIFPNYFHDFAGSMLGEHAETIPFNPSHCSSQLDRSGRPWTGLLGLQGLSGWSRSIQCRKHLVRSIPC